MIADENISKISKLLGLFSDLSKCIVTLLLTGVAVTAFASPPTVRDIMDKWGISEIGFLGIKIVRKAIDVAADSNLRLAKSLNILEEELSSLQQKNSTDTSPQINSASFSQALKNIQNAKIELDRQNDSIKEIGRIAGLTPVTPPTGWIYVGYLGDDMKVKRLSSRIDSRDGLHYSGNRLSGIKIKFDSPVIVDGDKCAIEDLDNVPFSQKESKGNSLILKASDSDLTVLNTAQCPGKTTGSNQLYAQVEIPKNRIRYTSLPELN